MYFYLTSFYAIARKWPLLQIESYAASSTEPLLPQSQTCADSKCFHCALRLRFTIRYIYSPSHDNGERKMVAKCGRGECSSRHTHQLTTFCFGEKKKKKKKNCLFLLLRPSSVTESVRLSISRCTRLSGQSGTSSLVMHEP